MGKSCFPWKVEAKHSMFALVSCSAGSATLATKCWHVKATDLLHNASGTIPSLCWQIYAHLSGLQHHSHSPGGFLPELWRTAAHPLFFLITAREDFVLAYIILFVEEGNIRLGLFESKATNLVKNTTINLMSTVMSFRITTWSHGMFLRTLHSKSFCPSLSMSSYVLISS